MNEDMKKDMEKVKNLKHGEECIINSFQDGGGLVYNVYYDTYVLFEIPVYGGKLVYENTFHKNNIEEMIKLAYTWT